MSFSASIEDVAEVACFRRMLSKNSKILRFVQNNDGTSTTSRKETLEVLLNTHFPNCVDPDSYPLDVADPICNASMMPYLVEIITRDRVKLTIRSFGPFKSPSPDGIFLVLLQHAGDKIYEYLVDVYKDYLW